MSGAAAAISLMFLSALVGGGADVYLASRAMGAPVSGQRDERPPSNRPVTRAPGGPNQGDRAAQVGPRAWGSGARLSRRAQQRRPLAFLIARPRQPLRLRSKPGGRTLAVLGLRSEFGSPQRLGVVRERGSWLGVSSSALASGRLGWVRRSEVFLSRTRISLRVDLSARLLVLRRGRQVVRRLAVAVGAPQSPTPKGRLAVTDKLSGSRFSPAYGCCILALSGHQPHPPAGWRNGNRLAIHGTQAPGTVGAAASAGCLRASEEGLRALMRAVPLGAPVFIHG